MATESANAARGVVVVDSATGRALRAKPGAIRAEAVLDCSGDFRAGEPVYVTMRGRDGGQNALAVGTAGIDASALHGEPPHDLEVVVAEGLRLLWRSA